MAPNNSRNNKKHPFVRFKRKSRLVYLKILRINDPPERIARGAAIGVLMGILPTFGIGTLLAFGASFIFKANKAAAVLGSLIMNPLTQPFFWTVSIVLGSFILGEDSATIFANFKNNSAVHAITRASLVYLTGNIIISAGLTVASYYIVKKGVIGHRRHKEAKRKARLEGEGSLKV